MSEHQNCGTLIAHSQPNGAVPLSSTATIRDVLDIIPSTKFNGKGPGLRAAAAAFAKCRGVTAEQVQIKELVTDLEQYTFYLEARRYTKETIKSYRYCISILLRIAQENGWKTPPEVMPTDWQLVLSLATRPLAPIRSLIGYAVRMGKKPSTFSEDDLRAWCQKRVNEGRALQSGTTTCSKFRTLMSKPELAHLKPLVKPAPTQYGVPLTQMHPSLRAEIEKLLAFWTMPFNPNRDGKALRTATTARLLNIFVLMVGYRQNVCNQDPVESIRVLATRDNVAQYVSWAIEERKIVQESLRTTLGALRSSLQNNPSYKDLDLTWIKSMIKQLQRRERSEIDKAKQRKLITYDVAEAIPGQIRALRDKAKTLSPTHLAVSHRNELLMLWLIVLPWRQRNLRECRLTGGSHPNLYRGPVASLSSATKPRWLEEREKTNPGFAVWQIHFTKAETKGKHDVTAYLTSELATKLDEYLAHREALIPLGQPDPGTLFLTTEGKAMSASHIGSLVRELTSQHAGNATTPHLFRDIVAYEWLSKNPADYVTLSKVLWHKNLEYTLKVYGSRFDESTGIARMDDWRSKR